MDSRKTRSKTKFRIKFLLGINPVTKFEPRKQKETTSPVLSYFPTAYEETVALPSLPSPTLSTAGGDEAENDCSWKKKRSAWQILKRALKETSLAKKIKKMKTTKDKSLKSNRNISVPKSDESSLARELSFDTAKRINSNPSSAFGCSYAFTPSPLSSGTSSLSSSDLDSSSSSEMSRKTPSSRYSMLTMKQRQRRIKESSKGPNGSNKAVCLLMVILLVLVLWGKACAILCASIWLFLVPHRSLQHRPSPQPPPPPPPPPEQGEFDSSEYKKKVIMEGLLERSHSRVGLGSATKSES